MENNGGIIDDIFFDAGKKRYEVFYDAYEVFELAGLEEVDDEEIQIYRVARVQSLLCRYAKLNDDFIAQKVSGQPKKYGFTKKQRLLVNDARKRNQRAERQIDNASERAERLLVKYPKYESELQIEIPKRKIILIKKSKKYQEHLDNDYESVFQFGGN